MAEKEKQKQAQQQEDDVVGKAYDGRLMRRLIRYLYPYKLAAITSLVAIVIKAGCDVLGPYLTKVAVDRYMTTQSAAKPTWLARHISPNAFTGITELAGLYLASLVLSYFLEFI